ncbi:MAG: nuclear transport factor 2 family protein [Myxococcaceae bacterium]|nr:nuclear transport factor 2 family protein [Myxococcaceae bacterium]
MSPIRTLTLASAVAATLFSTAVWAHDDDGCPWVNPLRSAEETLAARNAALAAGDLQGAMCAYAKDAVVIMPGSVIRGRDDITTSFASFAALFGGEMPTIVTQTSTYAALMITYTITGPMLSIPDGSDTFVVVAGRIVLQTVHATVVPTAMAP